MTDDYWKARESYNKAVCILKDQFNNAKDTAEETDILLQLGKLHLKMAEYEEAEENLSKALARDGGLVEAFANLGIIYIHKEDFKKAIRYFEDAIRRDPDDLLVRSNLAEAYLRAERVDRAEVQYKKILSITPYHVESQIGLGEVYTAMGEAGDGDMYDQAIVHFTKALKIAQSEKGSRKLKKIERAAVLYSKGYARVKLYETSEGKRDESLLWKASRDFKMSFETDQTN